jgi:predicted small metal-binding protein
VRVECVGPDAVGISDGIAAARKSAQIEIVVPREIPMARMFVDCRDYPSEMNCTVAISADTKKELVEAAVQHAVAVHGHHDSPQLREQLDKMIKTQ